MERRNYILVFLLLIMTFCVSIEAGTGLNKEKVTIYVNDTVQLKVNGSKKKATWTSSNKKVATVSSSGKVKGINVGNACITAHVGRDNFTCTVTVERHSAKDETDYQFVNKSIDDLISQNTYYYNNDLAGIAAEMSLATYQGEKDSGIRDYLSRMGFDKFYSNNYGGSLAFTLGTKKYTGSNAKDNNTYILAIVAQGSTNPYELIADALSVSSSSYNGYEVHDIVGSFRDAISEGLPNIVENGKKYIVFLTGHSLGGAAVNLLAAQLTDLSGKDFVICYTFGAINSIKSSSPVSNGYENIHNIYNNYDTFAPDHFGSSLLNGAGSKYGKFGHLDEYDKEYRSGFDAMKPAPVQIADHINHDMDKYWDAIKNGYVLESSYQTCINQKSNTGTISISDEILDKNYLSIYEDAMTDAQNRHDEFLKESGITNYNGISYALCDISGDGFKELVTLQREGKHGVYLWVYGFNGENNSYLGEIFCDPDEDAIYGYRQGLLYMDSYKKSVSLHTAEWNGKSFTDNMVYGGTKGWEDAPPSVYDLSTYYDSSRLLNKSTDFLPFDDLSVLSEYPDSLCKDSLGGTILAHENAAFTNVDSCLYDVIDEYRRALKNYDPGWISEDIENEYPRVNPTMIFDSFRFPDITHLFYIFYDIDNNGKDELLIGRGPENKIGIEYIDVFTSDGNSAIRFFDDASIGYRSGLNIYTDGTIQFSGSGGADHGRVEYWRIGDDGIHPHMILGYKYVYDSNGRHYEDVEGNVDPVEYETGFEYMDLLELEDWKAIVGEFDSSKIINVSHTEVPHDNINNNLAGNGEYILPNSSTQYLTDADVVGLDAASLRIARNEIYARHGRRFKSEDLQSYFDGKGWYKGTIAPDDFNESVLSDLEKTNVRFIEAHES